MGVGFGMEVDAILRRDTVRWVGKAKTAIWHPFLKIGIVSLERLQGIRLWILNQIQ